VEFKSPGSFVPLTDMVGGGPFGLKKGQWTDDTSMALCLAESLITCRSFDARDQMERYIRWWKEGHLSSTGRCFDIGNTVYGALQRYLNTGEPLAGSTDLHTAGNGSLMRLAPIPLFFAADPETAISMSAESSKTTHGATTCLDACRYFGGLLVGALQGVSKEELLSPRYSPVERLWERAPLCLEIDDIACGSFKRKNPPAIVGSGYVVESLEAALWAFNRSKNFQEGCLLAVNLGDDADTTGAIFGQLAGAYYGVAGIPQAWRECLAHVELIQRWAGELAILAEAESRD
jgi:ADP-ribosylglycohydrolase